MPAKPHAHPTAPAKPITMVPVKSTNIDAIGYDDATSNLQINFTHGGKYLFHGVHRTLYQQLTKAPSVGSFFHTHIRSKHKFTKLK